MTITLHKNDIPADLSFGNAIAVDSETLGLNPARDPLCLVQISGGDGVAHIVQLDRNTYEAPNLKKLLADPKITKIFHFARFDLAVIRHYLGVDCTPVYCTRTVSKLVRTYTDKHGLRDNCRELLGVELNKQLQTSDWGTAALSEEQLKYAAGDVLYLHDLKQKLDELLRREKRESLAEKCFSVLPVLAQLDLAGWPGTDVFEH